MKANFETGLKICSRCRIELPLLYFAKDKYSCDGYQYRCKNCSNKNSFVPKILPKDGFKFCSDCKVELPLTNFWKNKSEKDGYGHVCISCGNKRHKDYYENNKEIILLKQKETYGENPDKFLSRTKKYYEKNVVEISKKQKKYQKLHKKERNKYLSERRKSDLLYKLTCILRNRLRCALKENPGVIVVIFLNI